MLRSILYLSLFSYPLSFLVFLTEWVPSIAIRSMWLTYSSKVLPPTYRAAALHNVILRHHDFLELVAAPLLLPLSRAARGTFQADINNSLLKLNAC